MKPFIFFSFLLCLFCINTAIAEDKPEDDEWYGFKPEDAGITASEFDLVKEKGMPKSELLELLEYGIMPSEYFSEPWKKLGVSKSEWLKSKKEGLEDADIDRTVYTSTKFNYMPLVSFIVPGYYAYKTERFKYGGIMSGIFGISILLTFVHQQESGPGTNSTSKSINPIYPVMGFVAMVWSATDAYIGTRFKSNADASRFSFDFRLAPNANAALSVNF